jgi:succinate dehydrogenase/fumarate reductase cytochrome b subunit
MRDYLKILTDAFKRPTQEQKEAYARYLHTISAAVLIGFATLPFTDAGTAEGLGVKLAALAFSTLITFIVGAILAKGETTGDSK